MEKELNNNNEEAVKGSLDNTNEANGTNEEVKGSYQFIQPNTNQANTKGTNKEVKGSYYNINITKEAITKNVSRA